MRPNALSDLLKIAFTMWRYLPERVMANMDVTMTAQERNCSIVPLQVSKHMLDCSEIPVSAHASCRCG